MRRDAHIRVWMLTCAQVERLDVRVVEQKEEVAMQISRLDDVVIEELTRIDARVSLCVQGGMCERARELVEERT